MAENMVFNSPRDFGPNARGSVSSANLHGNNQLLLESKCKVIHAGVLPYSSSTSTMDNTTSTECVNTLYYRFVDFSLGKRSAQICLIKIALQRMKHIPPHQNRLKKKNIRVHGQSQGRATLVG